MSMSYEELGSLGALRRIDHCGPLSMFQRLLPRWEGRSITDSRRNPASNGAGVLLATKVAQKVKDFFFFYAINRHKMTTLTPSYHAENYGPEDNRFDLRPFLYPATFSRQFAAVNAAERAENERAGKRPRRARED